MEETGQELMIGNFKRIITDYEAENGEIKLMYREPRGSITHPHRDETITLGTLMVEDYERPVWSFNKLLYIEKEGAQEALKQDGWPERHDCAVMSSKGFSTRAARDLIDKLVEHDEPIKVFCAHDADASGTMIYQTLQEATKARGARKIEIVNIGLEPWEAVAMGLEVETFAQGDNRKPVADYVRRARQRRGTNWEEWLQTHRVELNAMTTPELIEWLDDKMEKHGDGKLIPPVYVLVEELMAKTEQRLRAEITASVLSEAGLEARVAAAMAALSLPDGDNLRRGVAEMFEDEPERDWRAHIEAVADDLRTTSKNDPLTHEAGRLEGVFGSKEDAMKSAAARPQAAAVVLTARRIEKNSLRGFFDLRLPSGLVLRGCSLHLSHGRWWIGMPARTIPKTTARKHGARRQLRQLAEPKAVSGDRACRPRPQVFHRDRREQGGAAKAQSERRRRSRPVVLCQCPPMIRGHASGSSLARLAHCHEAEVALIKTNRGCTSATTRSFRRLYAGKNVQGQRHRNHQILNARHALIVDMASAANFVRFESAAKIGSPPTRRSRPSRRSSSMA